MDRVTAQEMGCDDLGLVGAQCRRSTQPRLEGIPALESPARESGIARLSTLRVDSTASAYAAPPRDHGGSPEKVIPNLD